MKNHTFSLITPTHNPKYISELYESIKDQTYQRWEWVIWVNGGISSEDLPQEIRDDSRVRIGSSSLETSSIGQIKHLAFSLGAGDILVEVDHDDLLTPDCLEELNAAFQDEEVGFVFSDDAKLTENFTPYNKDLGWTHYKYEHRGKELTAMRTSQPNSCSIQYIWYAPDHVRAWRKSVYDELGGHNPEFDVCDDHELMIRTYLHTKMKKVEKVLYLYRIDGGNTWLERVRKIQEVTKQLGKKYARALAERECELRGLRKVDLNKHTECLEGYEKVEFMDKLPLEDNSVGVINASHVIQHLKDPVNTMREIHRVLAHGGWAFIEVPSTDGRGAWQDPRHVSFWNENSFFYYTKAEQAKFIENKDIRFMSRRLETGFPSKWYEDNKIPCVFAWLVAHKEDSERRMGPMSI